VFIDAALRGVMNALELCMYARGIESLARAELVLIGDVSDRDHGLLSAAHVTFLAEDARLGPAFLDRVRAGVSQRRRTTTTRRTVSG
jgi:predicted ATP-dependent Lon-type protease